MIEQDQAIAIIDVPSQAISTPTPTFQPTLDQMIGMWVHAKYNRSKSEPTKYRYTNTITQFREVLAEYGCDLDGDPTLIATIAQGWASQGSKKEDIASGTYNGKINCLSSFYEYAIKREYFSKNPMKIVERRTVEYKDYARPFQKEYVVKRLQLIDRSTPTGLRDYALLTLAFTTGRRLSELRNIVWGDFKIEGETVTVIWRRCKGGKVMEDVLQPGTWAAIRAYMQAIHSDIAGLPASTPIWIALGRRCPGHHLTTRGVSDIFRRRLDTGKVHSSRHTFAIQMENVGAKLSDIGARLGHENLSTTSVYMQRMHSAENEFAGKLEESFGIDVGTATPPLADTQEKTIEQVLRGNLQMSDEAIGRMMGISGTTIRRYRAKLGMSSWFDDMGSAIEQTLQSSPEMSDRAIGLMLGVGATTVSRRRKKLGIAPNISPETVHKMAQAPRGNVIDQAVIENPQMFDSAIASMLGVDPSTVGDHRKKLGLSSWVDDRAEAIDQILHTSPELSNVAISKMVGVNQSSVRKHRAKLGIAPSHLPIGESSHKLANS